MDLTKFKVKRIIFPHGDLQLGEPAEVIDEGGFYQITSTTIIDKFMIEGNGNRVEITMKNKTVVLEVI